MTGQIRTGFGLTSYLTSVPGDEVNKRLLVLRVYGYRTSIQGHGLNIGVSRLEAIAANKANLWDIILEGPPCGGDHPACLGTSMPDHYLCTFCAMYSEIVPSLREWYESKDGLDSNPS